MVKYWILWERAGPQSTLLVHLELLYLFLKRSTKFSLWIEALIHLILLLGWIQKVQRGNYKKRSISDGILIHSALAHTQGRFYPDLDQS